MEKIAVNNQIVSMRKLVKQAKLYAINKLVKQRKLLQLKKGTEAQLMKNKRKEERICEEISIIKKIPVDEVSRKSLMQSKDWKAVLLNKSSSLEERSFALLANFDPLQTEVKKFIAKNPRVVNLLPDFYEEWDAKKSNPMHQEAKKMKALELKLKRKQIRARLKGQDRKMQGAEKIRKQLNAPNRQKQVNDNAYHHENNDETVSSDAKDVDMRQVDSDNEDSEAKSLPVHHSNSKGNSVSPSTADERTKAMKKAKRKEITILKLDELPNDESLKVSDLSCSDGESVKAEDVVKESVKKDAFFMSGDALSDNDDTQDNMSTDNSSLSVNQRQNQGRNDRTNFRQKSSGFSQRKPFPKRPNQSMKSNFRQQRDFGQNQRNNFQRPINRNFTRNYKDNQRSGPKFPKDNKMGWKSPMSQKPPNTHDKKMSSSFSKRPAFKTGQTSAKKDPELHPSWEAKRKLKQPASLPFQGKKITFE